MEIKSKEEYYFKRGRKNNNPEKIGFSILIVLVGVVLLLSNIGIIPAEYKSILLSWQALVIVIGIWSLVKRNYFAGVLLVVVGGFFLYPKICNLFPAYFTCINIDIKTYWPVLLILFGILLIVRKPSAHHRHKEWKDKFHKHKNKSVCMERDVQDQGGSDYIEKNIMFGSAEQIVLSSNFRGGEGNVMFGELIIDLRKSELAEGDNMLELNVMFGNIVVYVPVSWYIEVQSSTVLGSFDDKRNAIDSPQESVSRLLIKGSSMFGNGEIRN